MPQARLQNQPTNRKVTVNSWDTPTHTLTQSVTVFWSSFACILVSPQKRMENPLSTVPSDKKISWHLEKVFRLWTFFKDFPSNLVFFNTFSGGGFNGQNVFKIYWSLTFKNYYCFSWCTGMKASSDDIENQPLNFNKNHPLKKILNVRNSKSRLFCYFERHKVCLFGHVWNMSMLFQAIL